MGFQISDLSSHPYWGGKNPTNDYFGFSPLESRKGSIVHVKEEDRMSGKEFAMCPQSGPDGVHITAPEYKAGLSGTVTTTSLSAPVEDGVGGHTFAYGPLGQEFIQTFFPELETDGSLNVST
jgi:hypothetical protein